jgi:hypothetical protein
MEGAQEIQQLLVAYAKQETIDPLRQLGRYLGFGLAGALMVFLGAFFLGLGVLRLTQSVDALGGSSWASTVPYLATIAALVVIVAILALSMRRAKSRVR